MKISKQYLREVILEEVKALEEFGGIRALLDKARGKKLAQITKPAQQPAVQQQTQPQATQQNPVQRTTTGLGVQTTHSKLKDLSKRVSDISRIYLKPELFQELATSVANNDKNSVQKLEAVLRGINIFLQQKSELERTVEAIKNEKIAPDLPTNKPVKKSIPPPPPR